MKLVSLFAIGFAAAAACQHLEITAPPWPKHAAPTPALASMLRRLPANPADWQYVLRVYAPGQPLHERNIMAHQKDGVLGIEGVVKYPPTPPLHVLPEHDFDNKTYMLDLPLRQDNPKEHLMLTAVRATGENFTKFLPIDQRSYPEQKTCKINLFNLTMFNRDDCTSSGCRDIPTTRLTYEGAVGHWEAVKNGPGDAPSNGWSLHFRNDGAGTQLEIDLVPVNAHNQKRLQSDETRVRCHRMYDTWYCSRHADSPQAVEENKEGSNGNCRGCSMSPRGWKCSRSQCQGLEGVQETIQGGPCHRVKNGWACEESTHPQ